MISVSISSSLRKQRRNHTAAALCTLLLTVFLSFTAQATGYIIHLYQEPSKERISMLPNRMMMIRMETIMKKSGFEKGKSGDRFLLKPVLNVLSLDSIPGTKPEFNVKITVKLTIGDGLEGTRYASVTIPLEGKGANKDKAIIEALRSLTPENKEITTLFATGKIKLKEYYTKNCSAIIKNAEELSEKEQHEMAILKLISIPDSCAECKEKAMKGIEPYYIKYINQQCAQRLASSKKIWTGGQTEENAKAALRQLSFIDPESTCFEDAKSYNDQITGYFKSQGKELKEASLKAPYEKKEEKAEARKKLFISLADKHKKAGGITTEYKTNDW